jgi:hypothetical protein
VFLTLMASNQPAAMAITRPAWQHVIDGGSHPFSGRDVDASGAIHAPGLPAAFTAGFARLAADRRGRRRRRLIVPSRTA